MGENIEFLKERAKEFWDEALRNFDEGRYNLASFHLEQAMQLFLKYLIGKRIGEWPKTHYLRTLVQELSKAYDNENILGFYRENELVFNSLEDAYFTSRYYPKGFSKNLVDKFIQNCKKFFEFLNKELGEGFL